MKKDFDSSLNEFIEGIKKVKKSGVFEQINKRSLGNISNDALNVDFEEFKKISEKNAKLFA